VPQAPNFSFPNSENVFADTKPLVADASFFQTEGNGPACCLKERAPEILQMASGGVQFK